MDNWRVSSLIVDNIQSQIESDTNNESTNNTGDGNEAFISIDLSRIPFTVHAKDSVKDEIASLHYELANLVFLSLNLPDSAEYYFNKVLNERPNSSVAPVSMYSLSELYSIQNNNNQAYSEAEELVRKYPNTVYADRLIDKYDIEKPDVSEIDEADPRTDYLEIINSDALTNEDKVTSLISFEAGNKGTRFGAQGLYKAIESYILMAKMDSGFVEKIEDWNQMNKAWSDKKEELEIMQDSARVFLLDSTISSIDSLSYVSLLDSTIAEPDLKMTFPYRGEYWDSTRSKIEYFIAGYSQTQFNERVVRLKNEFGIPLDDTISEVVEDNVSEVDGSQDSNYLSCDEIDQNIFIRGGEQNFLNKVIIPEGVQDDEISFLFFINNRGIIDEFKLSSETQNEELLEAFINTINENVSFEPVLVNGVASPVSCEVTFQVQR